ncbi:MAG: hypothetical protein Q8O67_00930 [Deltaproteobacteria bacterium]|nr:hypothetical protein [Deltaproteobacteria bacterium]
MLAVAVMVFLNGVAAPPTVCVDCWTPKCLDLRGVVPRCAAPTTTTKPLAPCAAGKERNADTADHCCWPGQAWSGKGCVGVPSACPSSWVVENDQCVVPACEAGMLRAQDALHCCWPGQAWSSSKGQCIGALRCPTGFTREEERCTSDSVIAARLAAAADAAERERVMLEEARVAAVVAAEALQQAQLKADADRAEAAANELVRLEAARLEEQRLQAERARIDAERQEQVAAWELLRDAASGRRTAALVIGGFGVLGAGVAGVAMAIGARQNDVVTAGGIGSGAAIDQAAFDGQVANAVAWPTGVLGVVALAVAGGVFAFNGDPPAPDANP